MMLYNVLLIHIWILCSSYFENGSFHVKCTSSVSLPIVVVTHWVIIDPYCPKDHYEYEKKRKTFNPVYAVFMYTPFISTVDQNREGSRYELENLASGIPNVILSIEFW